MNTKFLQFLPLVISLLIGAGIYCIAVYCVPVDHDNLKSLIINLSAALMAITITYFSYNLIKDITERKLNKTLFHYSKERIDNEIISILIQVQKMLYSFENLDRSFNGLSAMLDISEEDLKKQISGVELLGYQIFKEWDFTLNNIEKIIENAYTLKYLTNDQIISLVRILSGVERLNNMYRFGKDNVFVDTGKVSHEHMIVPPYQSNLPKRSILLKKIEGKLDEGIVVDHGDIPQDDLKRALNIYKVKEIDEYFNTIGFLLAEIHYWKSVTGNELFISIRDKRLFNPVTRKLVY
ncbi:MAG: hypothetical protein FWE52_01230 [Alphaproteobacteria bacterium]|nr:hypothetical protein [Alphaproteobacteria bacterium]